MLITTRRNLTTEKWNVVILRLWIKTVKLNYTGFIVLPWNIQKNNPKNDGYAPAGGGVSPTKKYNVNESDKEIEFHLINEILIPTKFEKNINSHNFTIIYIYMNTQNGREKFNNSQILWDSGCRSSIVIGKMISKLRKKQYVASGRHNTEISQTIRKLKYVLPTTIQCNKSCYMEMSRGWLHQRLVWYYIS